MFTATGIRAAELAGVRYDAHDLQRNDGSYLTPSSSPRKRAPAVIPDPCAQIVPGEIGGDGCARVIRDDGDRAAGLDGSAQEAG